MAWDRRLAEYQTVEKGQTTARYSILQWVKDIPRIVKRRDEVTTITIVERRITTVVIA